MYLEKKSRFPWREVILALIAFLINYTDLIPINIGTATPFLLIPLCTGVSFFYGETVGLWFGLFCGVLADSAAGGTVIFNCVFFMLAGFIMGVLANTVFNHNLRAACAMCLSASAVYFGIKWFVFMFLPDVQGKMFYLFRYSMPSAIYTAIFIIPLYFYQKKRVDLKNPR